VVWNTSTPGLVLRAAGVLVLGNGSFELGTPARPMLRRASVRIKRLNASTTSAGALAAVGGGGGGDGVYDERSDPYAAEKAAVGLRPFALFARDGGISQPAVTIAGRPLNRTWTLLAATVTPQPQLKRVGAQPPVHRLEWRRTCRTYDVFPHFGTWLACGVFVCLLLWFGASRIFCRRRRGRRVCGCATTQWPWGGALATGLASPRQRASQWPASQPRTPSPPSSARGKAELI